MNLTGGQYKGIKITVPQSARPTLSKVRESVFNILNQYEFKNNTFLDMFAGSGIMSLEALSRGYKVLSIEINPKNSKIIKENYKKLSTEPNIITTNALKFKTDKTFDIIYIDPPWSENYAPIIKKAYDILDKNGLIVLEHDFERKIDIKNILSKNNINLKIAKSKKYGRCLIDILLVP